MRYALIIVFGVCYYAGWLPASFVVPALLVISALRLPERGRTPRRGGYIAPPSTASAGESLGTAARVATYTDSFRQPGPQSEVRTAFTTPLGLSKTTAPGVSTFWTDLSRGRLTTAAEPPDWYLRQYAQRLADPRERFSPFAPPGDCGCGDTAA